MQTFEQWFDQDLNAPIITRYCESLTFSADNLSNTIGVKVYQDTQPVTVTGSVACTVIRQDGGTVTISGTSSGNAVSATLTGACFAVPGPIAIMLQIVDGTTKVTVLRLICTAVLSATDQAIDPGTIIPSVTDLIAEIDTAVASIPADYSELLAAIAPTFSASTAYSAGAYVWYDGDLYRFTADHAVGSWTGSDAAQVALAGEVTDLKSAFESVTEAHISKNLYDAATCGPEDQKMYWNGALSSSTMYACSGKIPVDASTQYIFSAGTVLEKYVEFFSGATGGTFISRTVTDGAAFTTPENCTYVAVMLFAQSHTTDEYNAAIAVAQLEKGSTATAYEPYGDTYTVPLDVLEDGGVLDGMLDAAASDVGKVLTVKAVTDGRVSEFALEAPAEKLRTRNLFDKDSMTCANNKMDYNGSLSDNSYYAFLGYAPVEASTAYIFSAGSALVKTVIYRSGTTELSRANIDGASFTTPATCDNVGFNIFAASHTETQFNDAVAYAQLEEGTSATAYVPYYITVGEKLNSMFAEYHGKNLYDKAACAHEDGKVYYNGAPAANSYYAITGIIPVEENMLYTFSAGGVTVKKIGYFKGTAQMSEYTLSDPTAYTFTTPAGCDGVGFSIFAASHTTEQYTAAINAAQLEQGDTATEYEAYQSEGTQSYSFLAQAIGPRVDKAISQAAMTGILDDPKRSTWWKGKKGDSLGDSITYKFNNFQKYVKDYLGLAEFYNNGMTGTKMAGPADATWGDSMWMDSRINALHADADFITILGGANDPATEDIGDLTVTNCDTSTYAGAFNVVLSKIYYRYNALSGGRYGTVDYTGVTQLSEPHNVLIIPCTQFYFPGGLAKGKEKADAIRTLSELWGLKVCDFWAWAQANPGVDGVYWTQADNVHPTALFYKERLAPLLISALKWLQPIEFGVE